METTQSLLNAAVQRARDMKLPYSGALLPAEAHALLQAHPGARLVDVRTKPELEFVGRVPGAAEIEWNSWPGSKPNADFLQQLRAAVPPDVPVLFLCRSGVRSHNAATAATQAGYALCINVLQGFQGDKDTDGHRNNVGGWVKSGLPWTQS
jgi:rhodanese-related sulfurtransferase